MSKQSSSVDNKGKYKMKLMSFKELYELCKTKNVSTTTQYYWIPEVHSSLMQCDVIFTTNRQACRYYQSLGKDCRMAQMVGYADREVVHFHSGLAISLSNNWSVIDGNALRSKLGEKIKSEVPNYDEFIDPSEYTYFYSEVDREYAEEQVEIRTAELHMCEERRKWELEDSNN